RHFNRSSGHAHIRLGNPLPHRAQSAQHHIHLTSARLTMDPHNGDSQWDLHPGEEDSFTNSNGEVYSNKANNGNHGYDDVEALRRENEALKEELKRLHHKSHTDLTQRDTHIQSLEHRLSALQSRPSTQPSSPIPGATSDADQIQLLRSKLGKAVQHLKHLAAENTTLTQRVGEGERRAEEAEGRVREGEEEVGRLKEKVEELKRQDEAVRQAMEAKDARIVELTEQVVVMKGKLVEVESTAQEAETDKVALAATVQRLEVEMRGRAEQLARMEDTNRQMAETIKGADAAQDRIEELTVVVAQLTATITELRTEKEDVQGRLAGEGVNVSVARGENKKLKDRVAHQDEAIEASTSTVNDATGKLQTAMEEIANLSSAVQSLSTEKDSLLAEIQTLTSTINSSASASTSAAPSVSTNAQNEWSADASSADADGWDNDIPDFEWKPVGEPTAAQPTTTLPIATHSTADSIPPTADSLDNLNRTITILRTDLADREAEITRLTTKNETLEAQVDRLEEAEEERGDAEDTLRETVVALRVELGKREAEVAGLQTKIEALQSKSSDTETTELQQRLEDLQTEVDRLRAMEKPTTALHHQIESLTKRLAETEGASRDAITELTTRHDSKITELENIISELQQQGDSGDARDKEHAETVKAYEEKLRALETLIADKERDAEEIRAVLARTRESVEALEGQVRELRKAAENIGERDTARATAGIAEEVVVDTLTACLSTFERAIDFSQAFTAERLDTSALPDAVGERLTGLLDVVVALRQAVDEREARVGEAEREVGELRTRMEEVRGDYEAKLSQSSEALASALASSSTSQPVAAPTSSEDQDTVVAELRAQYDAAQENVKRLTNEKTLLMDRLTQMKNSIVPKLQAEMETAQSLRTELHHTQSLNTHLQSSYTQSQQDLLIAQEQLSRLQTDLDRLRAHLVATEDAQLAEATHTESIITSHLTRIATLEGQVATAEERAARDRDETRMALERVEAMFEALEELKGELRKAELEKEREAEAAANLMRVLSEFQDSKQSEVDAAVAGVQKRCDELARECENYKRRAEAAESANTLPVDGGGDSTEGQMTLPQLLAQKTAQIGKLRHDVALLQSHLSESLRRLHDMTSSGELLDRAVVASLVCSFLELPRGDRKRFDVLSVLAGVLRLGEEERVRCGLSRGVSSGGGWGMWGRAPAPVEQRREVGVGESFTDMWISFLLKESSSGTQQQSAPTMPTLSPGTSAFSLPGGFAPTATANTHTESAPPPPQSSSAPLVQPLQKQPSTPLQQHTPSASTPTPAAPSTNENTQPQMQSADSGSAAGSPASDRRQKGLVGKAD
ncbi:uncharacterized protein EV422DRAFT_606572, partial [Fimicolochytrium jonesii]|uniref:uncharacterized protein n=1 Tax=Fimicolochytrium jonesii TaxID=1396493 RepID=UPI0022FE7297